MLDVTNICIYRYTHSNCCLGCPEVRIGGRRVNNGVDSIQQTSHNVEQDKRISITVAWDALRLGLGEESTMGVDSIQQTQGHNKHIPVITDTWDALRLGLGKEVTNLVFYTQSTITVTLGQGGRRVENQR